MRSSEYPQPTSHAEDAVPQDDADRELESLLGRRPRRPYEVVLTTRSGEPLVVRNGPVLEDGSPMPTRYWLVGREARKAVDRLEACGGVREAEAAVSPVELGAAHERYAAERDRDVPAAWAGPRPSGGVGGTRRGVKCLHAHYAWYLVGGDDPVGRWVAEQLGHAHQPPAPPAGPDGGPARG